MKGLFVKDLLLVKNQKRTLPLLLLCGMVMAMSMQTSAAIVYLTVLGTMISAGTISYDEMRNGYSFLFTLPVTRKLYVREKYIFSVCFCLVTMVLGLGISFAVMTAKGTWISSDADEWISFLAGSFLAASILMGSMIPVRLKYGTEKGSTALYLVYGILAAVVLAVIKGRDFLPDHVFKHITTFFSGISSRMILPCIVLFSVMLLLASEKVSERFVLKKEY